MEEFLEDIGLERYAPRFAENDVHAIEDLPTKPSKLETVLDAEADGANRQLRMIANLLSREEDKITALHVMERIMASHEGDADALTAYALLAIRAEQIDKAPILDGFDATLTDEHELEVEKDANTNLNDLFAQLASHGVHVVSLRNKANRLEELFMRLVENKQDGGREATGA